MELCLRAPRLRPPYLSRFGRPDSWLPSHRIAEIGFAGFHVWSATYWRGSTRGGSPSAGHQRLCRPHLQVWFFYRHRGGATWLGLQAGPQQDRKTPGAQRVYCSHYLFGWHISVQGLHWLVTLRRQAARWPHSMIPWKEAKPLTWDVTVVSTLADSYLNTTSKSAGGAFEIAATRKLSKYYLSILLSIFFSRLCRVLGYIQFQLIWVFARGQSSPEQRIRRPRSCSSVHVNLSYYNASISRWFMRLSVLTTMNRTSGHSSICFYHILVFFCF